MILRLIIAEKQTSAIVDLLEKKVVEAPGLREITIEEAAEIARPYLEDFLRMFPAKANAAKKT